MPIDHGDADSAAAVKGRRKSLQSPKSMNEVELVQNASNIPKHAESRIQNLTINKLRFGNLGLVGREKESEALRESFRDMMEQHSDDCGDVETGEIDPTKFVYSNIHKKMVFIKGSSGVGKTSLARSIKRDMESFPAGCFVEGKFDLNVNSKDQPYSGIAKAYNELFRQLKETQRDIFFSVGEELCNILGSEVEPITYLIPELDEIVNGYSTRVFSENDTDGLQERWKYGLRVLTRLLTAEITPLVVVIDDLQWADKASLDLIEHLITDVQNPNPLMIVGCYRNNEEERNDDLQEMIGSLETKTAEYRFHLKNINVGCFGIDELNEMVMKLLDVDDVEKTYPLAELCFHRTMGNTFFFIEFMKMLNREGMLSFDLGQLRWVFDVSQIEDATVSTDNVVELLKGRMQRMLNDVQLLLQYAACLGPYFRIPVLETLWENRPPSLKQDDESSSSVPRMIEVIENEMLIENCEGDKYRWVHGKIQEAAISFVESDIDSFPFEMGKILYLNLPEKQLEEDLFGVVDLLTRGEKRKSLDLALLCLRAATKAKKLSAFQSAAKYSAHGIDMLPDDKWSLTHLRSLTLDLYITGAQMELALGNVEQSAAYSHEILSRKDITKDERVQMQIVEAKRISTIELKYDLGIDYCFGILSDMEYKLVWKRSVVPVQTLVVISRMIKRVKKEPHDFYKKAGMMNDEKHLRIAAILTQIQYCAYPAGNMFLGLLTTCKIVEMTLEHGLCEYSAPNFATLGSLVLILKQNYQDATCIGEMALAMRKHYGRAFACQTLMSAYNFSLAWTVPLHSCTNVFYEAYCKGMENGETEWSMWSLIAHFLSIPYSLGKSLDRILEQAPKAISQMEGLALRNQTLVAKCYWQLFSRLAKPLVDGDPCQLEGEILTLPEENGTSKAFWGIVHFAECQLLLFHDHPSLPERAIKERGKFAKRCAGSPTNMIETFHRGVSLYREARRTRKRRYKHHANSVRKTLKKWQKAGNPNMTYYCLFLDAEQAALEGSYDKAKELYSKSILLVSRSGILHHAALLNERYADFLLHVCNDKSEAMYRLEQAIQYYKDWGANWKSDELQKLVVSI
ncbi:MAG: hypothetical protein SGBAC_004470 [Bacillariaceae sp.]